MSDFKPQFDPTLIVEIIGRRQSLTFHHQVGEDEDATAAYLDSNGRYYVYVYHHRGYDVVLRLSDEDMDYYRQWGDSYLDTLGRKALKRMDEVKDKLCKVL